MQDGNLSYIYLEQQFNEQLGESTGVLRFEKLRRSDDGLYECVARNKGDSAYKVGHITVEYAPNFDHMKALPPVYTWAEQKANLSCLAQGIPNATVEWKWNNEPIHALNDPNLQIEGNGPRSDLIVTPRERRYYTAYKCVAKNRLGQAEHIMELREARIPDAITHAKPVVVTATSITFEILAPAYDPGLPITAFAAQYKDRNEPDWMMAANRSWSPESKFTVEGLRPQTFYDFRFAALNRVGLSRWDAYVLQSTPARSVPEPPKILHNNVQNLDRKDEEPLIVSPYSDHFELGWSVPPDNGEPINFYQIKYCPVGVELEEVYKKHTIPASLHLKKLGKKFESHRYSPFFHPTRASKRTAFGTKSASCAYRQMHRPAKPSASKWSTCAAIPTIASTFGRITPSASQSRLCCSCERP